MFLYFFDVSQNWDVEAVTQAEEEMAKELARLEREEKARCEVCEAVVGSSDLGLAIVISKASSNYYRMGPPIKLMPCKRLNYGLW